MNTLKIKTKINCNTCSCTLNRSKAIKVEATSREEALVEVSEKIMNWKQSLKVKNCKVCESIIKEMAA